MTEPTKVYLVSKGKYSSYTIKGVFSAAEKAEAAMRLRPDEDFNDIEEFDLDCTAQIFEPEHVIKQMYYAEIRLSDGETLIAYELPQYQHVDDDETCCSVKRSLYEEKPDYVLASSYQSTEHAIKLAVEARQKWLREKEFQQKAIDEGRTYLDANWNRVFPSQDEE